MNIEEAIYLLKYLTKSLKQDEKNQIYKEAIETLLTTYEKEKERNKELSDKLTEKICKGVEEEILEEYRQTIISKEKEIEELKEKNRQGKMRIVQLENEITARIEDVNKYFTPNDKIKAKIEELNKDFKEYENGQEWEIQDEIRGQIDVLQSLLEKE